MRIIKSIKLLSICCLSILSIGIYAQDSIHKTDTIRYCNDKISVIIGTDSKGSYHGPVTHFYKSGKVSDIEQYKHGKLDGSAIYFYDSGDTSLLLTYKNNYQHGKSEAFYSNGKKMISETLYAGYLTGNATYFDESGKLFEGKFKNTIYRQGNSRIRAVNCVAGKPSGELIIFEETDCTLLLRYNYKDGLLDGKSYAYIKDTVVATSVYEKGGYVKEEGENYKHHIRKYSDILLFDKNNFHILYLRALAYTRTGDNNSALKDLNNVLLTEKQNHKAYYNRAVILSDSLPKQAMLDLQQTIKIKNDFYLAYYNMGVLFYRNGKYRKARDNFESAIKIKPDHYPSMHNLSMAYGLMGDKNMQEYYRKEADRIIGQ